MSDYTVVKFLHVTGAIGYFVALGILLFGVMALRRARRVEQVRVLTDLLRWANPLFSISILVILAAGLYMTLTVWSFQIGWIDVALVSLLIIASVAGTLVQSRLGPIGRLAREAQDGPLSEALLTRIHDPILFATPQMATALLLGIVFLMTNKPPLAMALLVMAIALILGLASTVLVARAARRQAQRVVAEARGSSAQVN